MLNRDATRVRAGEISHELFERGRLSERIRRGELEEFLGSGAKTRRRELTGVLLSLLRENDAPCRDRRYQPGFSEHFEIGVRMPLRIESRMRGIWSR